MIYIFLPKRESFFYIWVSEKKKKKKEKKKQWPYYICGLRHAVESSFFHHQMHRGNWADLLHSLIHLKIMDTCLELGLVHKINTAVPATVSST
jgi:hypothetical protein